MACSLAMFVAACGDENGFDIEEDSETTATSVSEIRRAGTVAVANGSYGEVIQVRDNVGGWCSGVLIADNAVLSAGHCFCRNNQSSDPCADTAQIRIWSGSSWAPQVITGRSVVHPNWRSRQDNDYDLALIILDFPIQRWTTDSRVRPVPRRTGRPSIGEPITVVGFGLTGSECQNGGVGVKRLNIDTVDAVNNRVFLLDRRITCDGDSGGPAFDTSGRLVGVVKGGSTALFQGDRTKLTGVWNNRAWIDASIPVASCVGGVCCPSGQTRCSGTCVTTSNNRSHCGACGRRCASGYICSSSRCTCPTGQRSCGGRCIDVYFDQNNCGGCGVRCAWNQVCDGGRCVGGPTPIF